MRALFRILTCTAVVCFAAACSTEKHRLRKYERYVRKSSEARDKQQREFRKQQAEATRQQIEQDPTRTSPTRVYVDY